MRWRAVLLAVVAGITGCSVLPAVGDVRSFDFLVINRSSRAIEVNTGTAANDFAAVLQPCGSLIGSDPDIRIGDALRVDGEVLWAFDHLPPPDMRALEVDVRDGGTSASLMERLPAGDPPAVDCG